MRGGIAVRSAQLAILALCVAAAVLIFLVALDTTPIADDYGDLAVIPHTGVFQYLHDYWVGLTDRYSNAVFMVALIKLFGAAAIHIATPLLIALLVCFCVACARMLSAPAKRGFDAVVVGCLAAITIAVSAPSIFDTLGWFNSVAIYLTGIVAAVGTAAWMAWLAVRRTVVTSRHLVASFPVGLVAAGFTELIGIVIALGSLLAFANLRGLPPRGQRRRSLEFAYLAIASGAIAGVLVILLGPGSHSRFDMQRGDFNLPVIAAALRSNLAWAKANLGWRTLLSIASGLAALHLTGAPRTNRAAGWLLVWALFLCFVPLLIVGGATGYSGSTVVASRTASIATASIAIGEAITVCVIAAALLSARPMLAVAVLPSACIAGTIALIGFAAATTPVIRAELLRQTAVAARAISIRHQLRQRKRAVWVMPTPLIDNDESAYDLLFEGKRQLGFVLAGIRAYYAIPSYVVIHAVARQPGEYCLPHVNVQLLGVKSCEQLGRQGLLPRTQRGSAVTRTQLQSRRA